MPARKKNTLVWFAVSVVLLLATEWAYRNRPGDLSPQAAAARAEIRLHELAITTRAQLEDFSKSYTNTTEHFFTASHKNEGEWMVYHHDSLVFWSGNQAPFIQHHQLRTVNNRMVHSGNGYYLISKKTDSTHTFVNLFPVVNVYRFTNYYLQNSFHPQMRLNGEYEISLTPQKNMYPVQLNGATVMYIGNPLSAPSYGVWQNILLALHIAGFFVLIICIRKWLLLRNALLRPMQVVIWVLAVGGMRLALLFGKFFTLENDSAWFNPEIFASSMWAPSLGDFFLNGWCVFFITTTLASQFEKTTHPALWVRKTAAWVLIPLFVLLSWYVQYSIRVLVQDSAINFSIRDISSFTSYSLLGLISVGLLLFSLYRLIHAWAKLSVESGLRTGLRWALVSFPLILVIQLPNTLYGVIECMWPVAACIMYILLYVRDRRFTINWLVILLGFFSLMSSISFHRYGIEKEKKNRLAIAERLSTDEDPETEFEFDTFEKKLATDPLLVQLTDTAQHSINNDAFYRYLDTTYFKRINNNYNVTSYLFRRDSTPVFNNLYNPGALQDLAVVLKNYSSKVLGSLRIIPGRQNGLLYAALIQIHKPGEPSTGILAVELRPKLIPDRPGLQELLWNKNQLYRDVLDNYSVLRFVHDKLILQTGNFTYSGDPSTIKRPNRKYVFFDHAGTSHLAWFTRAGQYTIVSYPHSTWLSRATSFSYVFIIFTLLFSTLLLAFRWQQWNVRHISLRGKIQLSLIVLLVVAMVLLAAGTQYIVSKQYTEKNNRLLDEKLESAAAELQGKITGNPVLDEDARNYIGYLLTRVSRVFHCDIHFYTPQGQLVASSLPEIFRFGIISGRMNPQALLRLQQGKMSEYIQNEQVASLGYLSGYKPLLTEKGEVFGYVNIPFFAPRASVDSEISSIVMAIVNIFVVLFVLALAASLVFTQIITAPLRKIQGSLASIQLNRVNQPIAYSGKDEIADLVKEYNRKVAELELYASELARSERESAWREMARQVAHEIKNPLTPMKLNVQHMQRSLKADDPDFEIKVQKLTRSLIEQIDILTHIADDFSNMAKMPLARMEEVELYGLIENVRSLFADTPDITIALQKLTDGDVHIKADRDQLVRVFNNLIKNSIQAIPEGEQGHIQLEVKRIDDFYQVTVSDNGAGIPNELRDRIFRPNFTTKSTGTGLGLAMVKSIIEQHGGQIWFESETNKGTQFVFTLPAGK